MELAGKVLDNSECDRPVLRYLSQSDLISLGADQSALYVEAIVEGLRLHSSGEFVQPLKPYLRWPGADHIADRIIAMPAYLGGDSPIAGIKWVGSRQHNPERYGLARASAMMILNDAHTNYPIAVMEGSLISGMRTAAITAVAARYLAKDDMAIVSCMGAGPIARMQLQTLLEQFPSIEEIHLFDLRKDSAEKLAQWLEEKFASVCCTVYDSAKAAIADGDLVVTCTVSDAPYIYYDWLKPGCFVANVSIMDIHKEVFLNADKVVVDDWDQCNREKKIINQLVLDGQFSREQLHAELGDLVSGQRCGRENENEIIVLNPMGMAVDDMVCAHHLYRLAVQKNIGSVLPLF